MTEEELIDSLKRILEGYEGLKPGEAGALGLLCAIQDTADFIGGEVGELLHRLDEKYCSLTIVTMQGEGRTSPDRT